MSEIEHEVRIYSIAEKMSIFIWFMLWLERNSLYGMRFQEDLLEVTKSKLALIILHLTKKFKNL